MKPYDWFWKLALLHTKIYFSEYFGDTDTIRPQSTHANIKLSQITADDRSMISRKWLMIGGKAGFPI